MRYQILMTPDGMVSGLIVEGSKMGDGSPHVDFQRKFDGSEPIHSFEVPPPPGPWEVKQPPLDEEQCWELAKVAYEAAMYAAIEALERAPCRVHAGEVHGDEAEELREGIETILEGLNFDGRHEAHIDESEVGGLLRNLLDRVDARDSLAHTEDHSKRMHRELHLALGLHESDLSNFSWYDLMGIVRKDLDKLNAVRKAMEP